MKPEIQPADPQLRRRTAALVALASAIGLLLLLSIEHRRAAIEAWLARHDEFWIAYPMAIALACFVMVLPLLGIAVYLFNFGRRVVASQRFPPPGQAVIRDTVVLTGRSGVWRGRTIQLLAIVLGVLCVVLPIAVWSIFALAFSHPADATSISAGTVATYGFTTRMS